MNGVLTAAAAALLLATAAVAVAADQSLGSSGWRRAGIRGSSGNPAQLTSFIQRFQAEYAPNGNTAFFNPKSPQTVLGLPMAQVAPRASAWPSASRSSSTPISRRRRRPSILLLAEDKPKATTTLFGCYYFYEK